ncbi:hypothetical protein [Spirosoma profusum]|nr:hypothetical protein [Spirosoma profusum]
MSLSLVSAKIVEPPYVAITNGRWLRLHQNILLLNQDNRTT